MNYYTRIFLKTQLLFLILISSLIQAQYFGGEKDDKGVSFCEVGSALFLTGNTRSVGAGSEDVWLIKINEIFGIEYNIDWGGPYHDIPANILGTSDNHVLVVGHSWGVLGSREGVFVTKYTTGGCVLWTSSYSGTSSDFTFGAEETNDGGYLVTGINRGEGILGSAFLIKLNSGGVKEWVHHYDTSIKDIGRDIVEGSDLSLYLLINTGSFNSKIANSSEYQSASSGIMIVKTDQLGNEIWRKNYGEVNHDFSSKIIRGIDDNFYFVGSSLNNTNGSYDITLNKIDSDGNVIWRKNYGGVSYDYAYDIDIDVNGDMIITGESNSLSTNLNSDIYVIKVDSDGNELWTKSYGGLGSDYGRSGKFLSDGTIGILGTSNSKNNETFDFYFIKIDKNGEIVEMLNVDMIVASDSEAQVQIFPNPARNFVRVNLVGISVDEISFDFNLYDITGKQVKIQRFNCSSGKVDFNSQLSKGVYIYHIKTDSNNFQGKIIIN
jgi:hypothetical protein